MKTKLVLVIALILAILLVALPMPAAQAQGSWSHTFDLTASSAGVSFGNAVGNCGYASGAEFGSWVSGQGPTSHSAGALGGGSNLCFQYNLPSAVAVTSYELIGVKGSGGYIDMYGAHNAGGWASSAYQQMDTSTVISRQFTFSATITDIACTCQTGYGFTFYITTVILHGTGSDPFGPTPTPTISPTPSNTATNTPTATTTIRPPTATGTIPTPTITPTVYHDTCADPGGLSWVQVFDFTANDQGFHGVFNPSAEGQSYWEYGYGWRSGWSSAGQPLNEIQASTSTTADIGYIEIHYYVAGAQNSSYGRFVEMLYNGTQTRRDDLSPSGEVGLHEYFNGFAEVNANTIHILFHTNVAGLPHGAEWIDCLIVGGRTSPFVPTAQLTPTFTPTPVITPTFDWNATIDPRPRCTSTPRLTTTATRTYPYDVTRSATPTSTGTWVSKTPSNTPTPGGNSTPTRTPTRAVGDCYMPPEKLPTDVKPLDLGFLDYVRDSRGNVVNICRVVFPGMDFQVDPLLVGTVNGLLHWPVFDENNTSIKVNAYQFCYKLRNIGLKVSGIDFGAIILVMLNVRAIVEIIKGITD